MHRLLALILAVIALPAGAGDSLSLTTESYVVVITVRCEEGTVYCDDVIYKGTHRKTGKSIRLRGKDMMHFCPGDVGDGPGKTPCRHDGYQFQRGGTRYDIWNDGRLEVWQDVGKKHPDGSRPRRLVVDEKGEWSQ